MYEAELLTLCTTALQGVFNDSFPLPEFQNLHISPEFPIDRADYPAVWVAYEPTNGIRKAGIGWNEYVTVPGGGQSYVRRWEYAGMLTYTLGCFSSLERARLFDEVSKCLIVGRMTPTYAPFRDAIEDNPLIAVGLDFDQIDIHGVTASGGTPWGTDEIIYEETVALKIWGEFVTNPADGTLVDLSAITVTPTITAP